MVRSFAIADSYYRNFGRLFSHVSFVNWRVIVTSLFGVAFIAGLLKVFSNLSGGINYLELFLVGAIELLFLASYEILMSYKNKQIVCSYNTRNSTNLDSLELVKIETIKNILSCSQDDFIGEAKKLDEIINLHNKYRSPFDFSVQSLRDWIYNKEARPRIVTYLVFLASSILVLSVREEASLKTVFEAYASLTWVEIGLLYMLAVFFLAMTTLTISMIYRLLFQWLLLIERGYQGAEGGSTYAANYLIKDLFKLHAKAPMDTPKEKRFSQKLREKTKEFRQK